MSHVLNKTNPSRRDALGPLFAFYDRAGHAPPRVRMIDGPSMPQPYRSLLVHDDDMTPTLQRHWNESIHLRVLGRVERESVLSRQVLLVLDSGEAVVEFGAINIHLDAFSDEARRLIVECHQPLGRILHDFAIPHYSRPSAFFEVTADDVIGPSLGVEPGHCLWGRCNVIRSMEGRVLAEVVEILPLLRDVEKTRELDA